MKLIPILCTMLFAIIGAPIVGSFFNDNFVVTLIAAFILGIIGGEVGDYLIGDRGN